MNCYGSSWELPLFGKYLEFTDEELIAIQEAIIEDPLRGEAYAKNEQGDLTPAQLKALAVVLARELDSG